ncbi:unnamed protein product [Ectocarpus fasciculatus]
MALFRNFFVVVPGAELTQIETIICNRVGNDRIGSAFCAKDSGNLKLTMVDETQLLSNAGVDKVESRWHAYSVQMALKLLASSLVQTPFYLTLDADVLCSKDQLTEEDLLPHGKANYVPEGRNVHPTWWSEAAKTLGVTENPTGEGFGVTPAVLSTSGATLALERLRAVHGKEDFLRTILDGWWVEPGRWWSEYTLYRTALDHFGVFDTLHATGPTTLLGETSVWFSEQFEAWNVTAAFDDDPAAFVVVQSTTDVGVTGVTRKLNRGLEEEEHDPLTSPGVVSSLRRRIVRGMGEMGVLSSSA